MSDEQHVDLVVIGSGEAGKNLAWAMASAGQRAAVIERKLIRGSCPNIACLPSKNIIHSAKVAQFVRRAAQFGIKDERRDYRYDGCTRAQAQNGRWGNSGSPRTLQCEWSRVDHGRSAFYCSEDGRGEVERRSR